MFETTKIIFNVTNIRIIFVIMVKKDHDLIILFAG